MLNQSKKVKYTTDFSKGIIPNLKEYFFSQIKSSKTNESDKKGQENNQEEEDEETCCLCNEEECEGNAEDSVWLQYDKCFFMDLKYIQLLLKNFCSFSFL